MVDLCSAADIRFESHTEQLHFALSTRQPYPFPCPLPVTSTGDSDPRGLGIWIFLGRLAAGSFPIGLWAFRIRCFPSPLPRYEPLRSHLINEHNKTQKNTHRCAPFHPLSCVFHPRAADAAVRRSLPPIFDNLIFEIQLNQDKSGGPRDLRGYVVHRQNKLAQQKQLGSKCPKTD